MSPAQLDELKAARARRLSAAGATEDQMNMRDTVPQRTDDAGTKIEDLAGTGEHDGSGG